MLTPFDWLRLSFTGAEIMATLDRIVHDRSTLEGGEFGPPLSALDGPCGRCRIYVRKSNGRLCAACMEILRKRPRYRLLSRNVLLAWACLNHLPRTLCNQGAVPGHAALSPDGRSGFFILDEQRYLQIIYRQHVHSWLQNLLLYDGGSLCGLIQLFPTNSARKGLSVNDLLCNVIHREKTTGMDQLRIRFYAAPYQVRKPDLLDQEGLLTFEAGNFLGILEMAAIFRNLLFPNEQEALLELLTTEDINQEQFYWGRFLSMISQEARDMLHAWQVRQWSKKQVQLFYELLKHVCFDSTRKQVVCEP